MQDHLHWLNTAFYTYIKAKATHPGAVDQVLTRDLEWNMYNYSIAV